MSDWWDDPQHRDSLSYAIVAMLGAAVAGAASLLKEWPRGSWVRNLGVWLSSLVTAVMAMAITWESLIPTHPGAWIALAIAAGWMGHRVVDRLASRVIGISGKGEQ